MSAQSNNTRYGSGRRLFRPELVSVMALLASACGSAADTSPTNDNSSSTAEELTPGVHSFSGARTGAATSDTDARSGVLPTGDGLEAAPVEPLPSGNNLS